MITIAQMFRMRHAPHLGTAAPDSEDGDPAILVIPQRSDGLEPHLVIVSRVPVTSGFAPGERVILDEHVVSSVGDGDDGPWPQLADVLVNRGTVRSMTEILDRHPGCEVVVTGRATGCLAALRDRRLIEIRGRAAGPGWSRTWGSFLHCWTCCPLELGVLHQATVIAGRFAVHRSGHGPPAMSDWARMSLRPRPAPPTRRAA